MWVALRPKTLPRPLSILLFAVVYCPPSYDAEKKVVYTAFTLMLVSLFVVILTLLTLDFLIDISILTKLLQLLQEEATFWTNFLLTANIFIKYLKFLLL